MATYRGFTVSFNSIGAGKTVRKYLLLACYELLTPLLLPANRHMIEAKCSCQLIINTRAIFRKGAIDTWVKYQLVIVIAPTLGKHAQAKKLIENILPGSVILEEYRDTALTRVQCNEFVPDNKFLVFGFHRNGICNNRFGEVYDLRSPTAPYKDKETNRPIHAPWHRTKRERSGVFLPIKGFPLQHKLNIMGLLDMLLLGVDHEMERVTKAKAAGGGGANASNASQNRSNDLVDAFGQLRSRLVRKRPLALPGVGAATTTVRNRLDNRLLSAGFELV